MHKRKFILWITVLIFILTGCNMPESTNALSAEDQIAEITALVETVYAELTQTAKAIELLATKTFTPTPEPTFTETPLPTSTPTVVIPSDTPAVSPTETPTETPSSDLPCLRANLETKSIPDGKVIFIERFFTQTFRIKNTGSCTWNSAFELRFAGGDLMNASASISITSNTVPTWSYATVDVLMKAPLEPGTYKGFWSIKSNDGQIFGVQPNNGSFWTEVKVINPDK
jgi:hypothetical protein